MAVETVIDGEHADSNVGRGLAERDLGMHPGGGLGAKFESEAAGDCGGVTGDRAADVDATLLRSFYGGERSAEGAGGWKGGVNDDFGKHFGWCLGSLVEGLIVREGSSVWRYEDLELW